MLRIDGSFGDDRYQLQLQIWNRRTGEIVTSERERCKLCLADDMLRLARNQTAYVVGRAFATDSTGGTGTKTKPAIGSRAGADALGDRLGLQEPPRHVSEEPGPHAYRWLGWTLVGVSGASAVVAVIEWRRDKQGFDCADVAGEGQVCLMRHRTWPAALALAGVAALGGGFGTWLLLRAPSGGRKLSLSVSPSWVGLGGVF